MGVERVHKEMNLDLMARHAGLGNANTAQLREFARMVAAAERDACIESCRTIRGRYTQPDEKDCQVALDWAIARISAREVIWEDR